MSQIVLNLNDLQTNKFFGISPAYALTMIESAAVAFLNANHSNGVSVVVNSNALPTVKNCSIVWTYNHPLNAAVLNSHNDNERTVDAASVGIALAFAPNCFHFIEVSTSIKNTGIDFIFFDNHPQLNSSNNAIEFDDENFLADANAVNPPSKVAVAVMEVSGIQQSSPTNKPEYRFTKKTKQAQKYNQNISQSVYISISEFHQPSLIFHKI